MKRRPELERKLESWVNRLGGDAEFGKRISEVPKTVQVLVLSSPHLLERFKILEFDTSKM